MSSCDIARLKYYNFLSLALGCLVKWVSQPPGCLMHHTAAQLPIRGADDSNRHEVRVISY